MNDSKEYLEKINTYILNLNEAKKKVYLLRKRYNKDTINIGVSGFTHAGKSTLLQAISGLSDEELPKADEFGVSGLHPTTAICSQIFNSEEKRAEITFKSEDEFVAFVNAHLHAAGMPPIQGKNDVQDLEIPENEDSEPTKNTVKERLRLIQESFKYYKKYIDNGSLPIKGSDFNRINSFVSYSKDDETMRFYPAVKEAKIYCPFPALDNPDTKLCLVDLPGFGEFDEVDKIQTQNLKEIVDHVIFIYKTNKDEQISNKKYRESFDAIINIHEYQKNNNEFLLNFLSFFINEDHSYGDALCDSHVKQAVGKDGIAKYGNYKFSSFPALLKGNNEEVGVPNVKKAKEYLNEHILERLVDTLPLMDDILIESMGQSFDIDGVRLLLKDLVNELNTISVQNEDASEFHSRGRDFRADFTGGLNDLLKQYVKNYRETDKMFEAQINKIKKEVDSILFKNLFYNGKETWEKYIQREMRLQGSLPSCFGLELHRLWVEIINNYEKLDIEYNEKLKNLKKQVLELFASLTGTLIKNKEADNFSEIIEKLSVIKDNQIYGAFVSLETLKQDFRQNIYPFLFKKNVNNMMEQKGDMENTPDGEAELDIENLTIQSFREQLVTIGEETNFKISNVIKENYISSHFLIGALHTFKERIVYVNTDSDFDFIKFCSLFRKDVYPNEFGSDADNVKLQELKKLIEETRETLKTL